MAVYSIAGFHVYMTPKHKILIERSKKYLYAVPLLKEQCDIVIEPTQEQIAEFTKQHNHKTVDSGEYHLCGYLFFKQALALNALFVHSSAVSVDGNVYLFSAPKGTGKSTHTKLWKSYFGSERAVIIHDDKPLVRVSGGEVTAWGSPFSGKSDISCNKGGSLSGICFLQRGENNKIEKLSNGGYVLAQLLSQSFMPATPQEKEKVIYLCKKILESVPVYKMECTISNSAVELAYSTMNYDRRVQYNEK